MLLPSVSSSYASTAQDRRRLSLDCWSSFSKPSFVSFLISFILYIDIYIYFVLDFSLCAHTLSLAICGSTLQLRTLVRSRQSVFVVTTIKCRETGKQYKDFPIQETSSKGESRETGDSGNGERSPGAEERGLWLRVEQREQNRDSQAQSSLPRTLSLLAFLSFIYIFLFCSSDPLCGPPSSVVGRQCGRVAGGGWCACFICGTAVCTSLCCLHPAVRPSSDLCIVHNNSFWTLPNPHNEM